MSGLRRRRWGDLQSRRSFRPLLEKLEDRELPAGLPLLSSRPDAPAALYLDFDGQTVGSTTYQPYDTNGDPANFNAAEQAAIIECWRHISVYFAMFDVDVTTVFDDRPKAWLMCSNSISGGYAYVGVFPSSQPLAFNESSHVTGRQSAIAHEFGHNLNLWHQSDYDQWGNKTAEYSNGYDAFHVPIMGVDFTQRVRKWFIGHPSTGGGAATLQDEVAIIASHFAPLQGAGGDGFAPDDFAGTFAGATPLPTVDGLQTVRGIIERMNDLDTFSFSHTGGTLVLDLYPETPSGLDAKLELYDSSFTLIAAHDPNQMNEQRLTLNLPAGTYYAVVSSHGDYGDLGVYQLTARKLPNGWSHADIGSVGMGGTFGFNSTTGDWTLNGGGADIFGTADAFHYGYVRLNGNGRIVAHVTQNQNTAAWAKVGVMMRETLASNSPHVSMFTTAGNGPQMVWRSTVGGSSSSFNPNTGQAFTPRWVSLERQGNVFTASLSTDGINWTQFNQQTVTMGQTIYVGVASGAVNNNRLNSARLRNVKLYGQILPGTPAPTYNGLASPTNVNLTLGTGTNVNVTWDAVAGATGYAIDRSNDGANWSQIGTTAGTSFSATGLFGSMRHFFRVRATDGSGSSSPSAVRHIVNRPNAPGTFSIASTGTTQLVLNWRDVSGDTGYRIERSTDGVNFTSIATIGTNRPSYTDDGLTVNTQYWYRLAALSPQGDSAYSAVVSRFTRLPNVTGLQFTSVTSTQTQFQWNAVAGATSYRIERSTDGSTYSTLATVGTLNYTDTGLTALQSYYYRVWGVHSGNNTQSQSGTVIFAATPATTALPSPWSQQDIGAVGGSGAAGHSSGTFTVLASGADIWNTSDQFRYVYQNLSGDGQITARVVSLTNTNGWAKAGVMIRESLAANSKQAMTIVSATNGTAFQRRTTTGGSSFHTGGSGSAPYWVRLVRIGSTFSSYVSSNGTTWTLLNSVTISMTTNVYVGLATCATNNSRLTRAVFDNVSITLPGGGFSLPGGGKPGSFGGRFDLGGFPGLGGGPTLGRAVGSQPGGRAQVFGSSNWRGRQAFARQRFVAETVVVPPTAPVDSDPYAGLPKPGHQGCTCPNCSRALNLAMDLLS